MLGEASMSSPTSVGGRSNSITDGSSVSSRALRASAQDGDWKSSAGCGARGRQKHRKIRADAQSHFVDRDATFEEVGKSLRLLEPQKAGD
jgi:hypothetical protein